MTLRLILRLPVCALLLAALLTLAPASAARADVLTTTDGLVLEGKVEKLANGWYRIRTKDGAVEFAPKAVASVKRGASPRADFLKEAAKVAAKDEIAIYRLALKAEEAGLADVAQGLYRRLLKLDEDHLAARRALGYEKVGGAWIASEEAQRRKGLVLYRGRWMLPAEVEAMSGKQAPALEAAGDVAKARKLVHSLATGAAPLQRAARLALARTDDRILLEALLGTLYDKDAKVRIASARLLAELGDESALRALIFSGARDKDAGVRRECVLAAQAFGHDDTALPFVRALGSKNLRLAGNAAEALALLGDERAAGYIVKRMRSHGSSTRNFVSFLNQVSYVRDYDVEIAQASNIANPDVATINEGVILDVKVLDASYTSTWIEPLLVRAFGQVVGESFRSAGEVRAWYDRNGAKLPRFPEKPRARAPRRASKGKIVGVPGH